MFSVIKGESRVNDDMKILSVVGARPNFMKIAPIILAIEEHNKNTNSKGQSIHHILLHTGQHYDEIMSGVFFDDLKIQKPDIYLGVGSASHAVQTAEIMSKFEQILIEQRPDLIIVVGDVNSTLACSLVAGKMAYRENNSRPLIAHVEAGLRSFDRTMPEEINRILTDHLSDFLFVSEESGLKNLRKEGIPDHKIFFVGNTMIDTLLLFKDTANKSKILERLGLRNIATGFRPGMTEKGNMASAHYALVTLHRPANVDDKNNFASIIKALDIIAREIPILFPCHPRTRGKIKEFGFESRFALLDDQRQYNLHNSSGVSSGESGGRLYLLNPQGYLDFLCLMSNARVVLTDSGGIQEETTCLGVPCITVRENTERPVTLTEGTNIIAGTDENKIVEAFWHQYRGCKSHGIPDKWDGEASRRIILAILNACKDKRCG
jgi:UDP-N-acetylglucosamine 2-epimerase (non-hydrolysing)